MENELSTLLPKDTKKSLSWVEETTTFFNKKLLQFSYDDDAVTIAFKQMHILLLGAIFSWIISYVLIMIQIATHGKFSTLVWPLFLPLWLGTFLGIAGCVTLSTRVCYNGKLIPNEGKVYLSEEEISHPDEFVELQSLPLMRHLFCQSIVFTIFLLLILISQILFYCWFIGSYSLWCAFLPVFIFLFLYNGYLYLTNIFQLPLCYLFSMVIAQLILFVLKESQEWFDVDWLEVLLPSMYIIGYIYSNLFYLAYLVLGDYIRVSREQTILLLLYVIALTALTYAILVTMASAFEDKATDRTHWGIAYFCWLIALPIIVICYLRVLYKESMDFINRRGYEVPLALSHTEQGWTTIESHDHSYTWMIGKVEFVKKAPSSTPFGCCLTAEEEEDEARNENTLGGAGMYYQSESTRNYPNYASSSTDRVLVDIENSITRSSVATGGSTTSVGNAGRITERQDETNTGIELTSPIKKEQK